MRNIVNIDITQTEYVLGYANEGSDVNEIELQIISSNLANPYIEITTQDESIEITEIGAALPFEIYKNIGTIKIRVIADDYTSDYISLKIPEELFESDNVIVKIEDGAYLIRKVKKSSGGGSVEPGSISVSVNDEGILIFE